MKFRLASNLLFGFVVLHALYILVLVYIFSPDPSEAVDLIAIPVGNVLVFLPLVTLAAVKLRTRAWVNLATCIAVIIAVGSLAVLFVVIMEMTPFALPWLLRSLIFLYAAYALVTAIAIIHLQFVAPDNA
jgi:hypothetical protein